MNAMIDDGAPQHRNPFRWLVWGGAALLLSLPAIAMQLKVEGVYWTASDFLAMGVILAIACSSFELVMRLSGDWMYRAAGVVAIGAGFLLVWANLAVGLVADGFNAYNMAFMGVLAVGVAGALVSGFSARGLSNTLVAMAMAQAVVVGAALASGLDRLGSTLSAAWIAPWILSAILFRMAAARRKV